MNPNNPNGGVFCDTDTVEGPQPGRLPGGLWGLSGGCRARPEPQQRCVPLSRPAKRRFLHELREVLRHGQSSPL
jgi:hypothetical protein